MTKGRAGTMTHDDVRHGTTTLFAALNQLAGRDVALDPIQEADELLVAMALHALTDDRPVQDVERGEQRGRPVALVVVMGCTAPAR